MHGLGNDFVIIDNRKDQIKIKDKHIQKLSDRRTGAGCDQLITINNTSNANADIAMNNVMGAEVAPPPEPPTQ